MGYVHTGRRLSVFVCALCVLLPWMAVEGQSISLGDADLTVEGNNPDDQTGLWVTGAGDMNDDGYDDFAVGTIRADTANGGNSGRMYIVFGGPSLGPTIDLDAFGPSDGIIVNGASPGDKLGRSIAPLEDFNGDTYPDLAVGSYRANFGGRSDSGLVSVIFGGPGLPSVIDIDNLGANGVHFGGASYYDELGSYIASAGDFNDDGLTDLLAGAERGDPFGRSNAGECYLIFGSGSHSAVTDLQSLGSSGIVFKGADSGDNAGSSSAGIGDCNGDDIDDIIIGAKHGDPNGTSSGEAYVIFGQASTPTNVDLDDIGASGLDSMTIHGMAGGDHLGTAAAGVGDFNDDGLSDFVVCGEEANRGGMYEVGEAYLIMGSTTPPSVLDASSLGTGGYTLRGLGQGDRFGRTVAGLGDVNGDGIDDFIIGADRSNPGGANNAGNAYVIHGGSNPPSLITGGDFHTYGDVYEGKNAGDQSGTSVASAGDINGDGGNDFLVSAICASPHGRFLAGEVYLFHGESVISPNSFLCDAVGTDVSLTWENGQTYDNIDVFRDGVTIATVPGGSTSYSDNPAPAGTHTYAIRGHSAGNVSGSVQCSINIIVLPPFDLTCEANEKQVNLTWVNGQSYTSIEVYRDGQLVGTLGGMATTFSEAALTPGTYQYCVRGINGTDASTDACCDIEVPLPVEDLVCTVDGDSVTLDWVNGQAYDSVVITRDGGVIVTLPGTATTFTDLGVAPGSHDYEVFGETGGSLATGIDCNVFVVPPVDDFTCSAVGDTVTLTWTNPFAYDAINVIRDDSVIATLPGGTTTYDDTGLLPGPYTYEIVAEAGGGSSVPVACDVSVLITIKNFECSALEDKVFLSWTNGQVYDTVDVIRDGVVIATLPGIATTYSDTGAPPGPHTYEVVGVVLNSVTESVSCDIEVLNPVFDVTCMAAASTVTLGWSNGSTYDLITIERNGAVLVTLAGTATSYVDTVSPGSYIYSITGSLGNSVSGSVDCEVIDPGAPSGLDCSAVGDTATISWTNGDVYDDVEVYVDGLLEQTLRGSSTTTTLTLGTGAHTICIVGIIGTDSSNPGCCSLTIPLDISGFNCTASGNTVTLSWSNGQPYETIDIYRDAALLITIPGFVEGYTDTSVPGGVHTYELVGNLGGGATLPASCAVEVLAPITDFTCSGDAGTVTLSWTPGQAYDGIAVHRNGLQIATLAGTASSYTDPGLSPGFYTYALTGFVGTTTETSAALCSVTLPLSPFDLNCTLEDGESVNLNWSNSQVGDSILVLRDGAVIATLPGNQSTHTDEPVAPGTYEYCVVNEIDGNLSVASCCTVIVPVPPVNVTCTSLGDGVELTWSNGEAYDSVLILRNGLFLAAVPGSQENFFDPAVPSGAYTYSLTGFMDGFESANVNCTVVVPPPPSGLVCDFNFSTVELSWTLSLVYDSITILRNGSTLVTLPGDATFYMDNTVTSGTYDYEVFGTIGADQSPSATCSVEILPGPANLSCCAEDTDVQLAWSNPLAYDSIEIYQGGFLIATLPGDATSYTDNLNETGTYSYDLVGYQGAAESAASFCSVTIIDPPFNVVCEIHFPTHLAPDVLLGWDNGDNYDSIQIERNGTPLASVGGFTSTYLDLDLPEGTHQYVVIGTRTFGDCSTAKSTICSVEIVIPVFKRADANNDLIVNIADSVWTLNYLFAGGPVPPCLDAADMNDDGGLDISDSIYLLGYIFMDGPEPPPPFQEPGVDPTDDLLGCDSSAWAP